MKIVRLLVILSLPLFPFLGTEQAYGQAKGETAAAAAEPTKEQRAQMVKMHEQMAACLKSKKKFSECQAQMMESCPMKDGNCPMGHPGHGGGHHHHHQH